MARPPAGDPLAVCTRAGDPPVVADAMVDIEVSIPGALNGEQLVPCTGRRRGGSTPARGEYCVATEVHMSAFLGGSSAIAAGVESGNGTDAAGVASGSGRPVARDVLLSWWSIRVGGDKLLCAVARAMLLPRRRRAVAGERWPALPPLPPLPALP